MFWSPGPFCCRWARVTDLYGRVRFYLIGMTVFAFVSLASAFAPSIGVLLALRAVHGVSLALGMVPVTALVTLAYPPESRGRALGLNIAGVYLGLTVGPVLGGLIIHNLGWRSLFLIVGGLGSINLGVALWKLRGFEWKEPKTAGFDFAGSGLWGVSLAALLLGLSLLPGLWGIILVCVAVVGLAGFFWWETRAADPLLRVDLLRRNRVFASSNLAALINYAATFAMVFLMSSLSAVQQGAGPANGGSHPCERHSRAGNLSLPAAGRLADRVQPRYVATARHGPVRSRPARSGLLG